MFDTFSDNEIGFVTPEAQLANEADVLPAKKSYNSPFRLTLTGVEKRFEKKDPDTGETVKEWRWVCSPLAILAATRTTDSNEWGRLICVTDLDGNEHTLAIPMRLLAGDGLELRKMLLDHGLRISSARFARDALAEYIQTNLPADRVRCVSVIGWNGDAFVMHKETIGATDQEKVLFQTDQAVKDPFEIAGTLQEWQDQIAIHARGNSRLMFALSAAFAGPLMHLTGTEGGGFHFVGPSSSGKSTLLKAAASIWGRGSASGFVNSWRSTDNALEGTCAGRSDTLLCLDELKEADPRTVAASVYMVANGQAKARANRGGGLRSQATWRAFVLSNGEMSIKAKLSEAGESYPAGIAVRFLEIPADTGTTHRIYETVHSFADGSAMSQYLTDAASKHHGIAARAFLETLTADIKSATIKANDTIAKFVSDYVPANSDGQVHRAARRFGLVAAGGELGIEFGVLPWPEGHAVRASAKLFKEWMAARGGVGSAEETEHLATVRRFIELHGTSRFEPMGALALADNSGAPLSARTINRAGYRRTGNDVGDIEYVITPETWKSEVCKGLDPNAVAKTLLARGMIEGDSQGRSQKQVRLPGNANPTRVYVLTSKLFEDA